jgi:DNA-binding response OmpR family regulator
MKVLVVDDATFVRDMVKRTVRQIAPDVELFEAIDGVRATALIKQKSPDLILSDWEMPEMNGEQLLKWLRAQPDFTATPFIMITSRGDRNHVIAAVNAGVSDYISKPFTAEELTRKIHKQLKRLGYTPKAAPSKSGGAFSSLEVLTGGAQRQNAAGPVSAQASPAKPQGSAAKPRVNAQLRLPSGAYLCDLREISLQAMSAVIERTAQPPQLFEQAAVDLMDNQGEVLARLNAYIHALSASTASPDAMAIRVNVRFVDQDPAKLEILSKLIASAN